MSFVFQPQTRHPTTIRAYLERAEDLKAQVRNAYELHADSLVDPRLLVAWISSKRTQYSSSTWRQYKSACVCCLESELSFLEEGRDPIPWIEALELLKVIDGNNDGAKGTDKKTSSRKMKKFPQDDLEKLLAHLKSHTHELHDALADWLQASMWTGLRPVEWRLATWSVIKGLPALVVHNAKHTNGRAHGDTRTVILHRMQPHEVEIVKRHLERVQHWDAAGKYKKLYEGCVQKMYYATRRLWPNRRQHLTLYSARHQFVADAKTSNLSLAEIAALMGHAVDDTASSHYGKRAAGQQILKVQALNEEVQRIRMVFHGHPDRRVDLDPTAPIVNTPTSATPTTITPKSTAPTATS